MFDKDDKHCDCACQDDIIKGDPECTCDDENCDCGCNTITLDMEDGSQKDFTILEIIEHEGRRYIALAEVDTNEYDIMGMDVTGETVELTFIQDDDEFNAVAAKFEELFAQDLEQTE